MGRSMGAGCCELCADDAAMDAALSRVTPSQVAALTRQTLSLGAERTICYQCCQELVLVGSLLSKWRIHVEIRLLTLNDAYENQDDSLREIKNEIFTEMDLKEVEEEEEEYQRGGWVDQGDDVFNADARTELSINEMNENSYAWNRYDWVQMSENYETWMCKVCSSVGRKEEKRIGESLKNIVRALKEHEASDDHAAAKLAARLIEEGGGGGGGRRGVGEADDSTAEFVPEEDSEDDDDTWGETKKKKTSSLKNSNFKKSKQKRKDVSKLRIGLKDKKVKKKKFESRGTNHSAKIPSLGTKKNQWNICPTCGKYCVNEDELAAHVETSHKDGEELTCEFCGVKLDNIISLQQHRRSMGRET